MTPFVVYYAHACDSHTYWRGMENCRSVLCESFCRRSFCGPISAGLAITVQYSYDEVSLSTTECSGAGPSFCLIHWSDYNTHSDHFLLQNISLLCIVECFSRMIGYTYITLRIEYVHTD